MVALTSRRIISLQELADPGRINDEEMIIVTRSTVNLRIVELSSSESRRNTFLLQKLTNLLTFPRMCGQTEGTSAYFHLSAKIAKELFCGMQLAPRNAFAIIGHNAD